MEKEGRKKTATVQIPIKKLYFVSEKAMSGIVGLLQNDGSLRFVCALANRVSRSIMILDYLPVRSLYPNQSD